MPAASLQVLLAKSIDYAGMFPPCSLDLESALGNQAQYVRSPDAWMLGAFVLPVEQFDAARYLLSQFDPLHPLRVAALGPKTGDADAFLDAVDQADAAIRFPLLTSFSDGANGRSVSSGCNIDGSSSRHSEVAASMSRGRICALSDSFNPPRRTRRARSSCG